MGSEQLSILFGVNLFGNDNWEEKDQLGTTKIKNKILKALIDDAKDICNIQTAHIRKQ